MRLFLLVGLLAFTAYSAPANTTGKGLGELINDIKNIEDDLMKTVFSDIKDDLKEAVSNKKSLEEAAIAELQKKASEFKQKVTDALQKFNEAKEAATAKIEEERQKMVDEFKAKLEEKRAAKEAELKEAKEKFDQFKQQVKEKLEAKKAEKEQKRQEMKAKLEELAQTIKENRETRKAEKEARKAEEKQERDAFLDSFKSQLQSLEEEKKMLESNYEGFKQKEEELKQQLKEAMGASFKEKYADSIEDYLQDNLEKEYVKRGVENIIYPSKQVEGKPLVVASGPVVAAAPKASLIDQLTGKSSWETVAWVLLALCIVLAVALIVLIVVQVRNSGASKNGNYERLDGHNEGGAPLGTEKQGLLASNPKKSNTLSGAPGGYSDLPSASTPPSAPIVEEAKEQQQF
ncbi:hypothetical protein PENTCL1PPCAC_25443 [Pristionchus entomophagus]|uniref:Uncharacterized protein n=1 Tax=Pristionchus entomophagus TaxID=358040 RepID=A0AAV5UA46_9BILA|nr:hypothetical protein PENTCL1PPCAC_25443 [Pristionchus entomophagus]